MKTLLRRFMVTAAPLGLVVALAGSAAPARAADAAAGHGFVTRVGGSLRLDGHPYRFAGTNNYYLEYKSPVMVDDVIDRAAAAGFQVIRHWGFVDIGDPTTGAGSIHGKADGVYFQYWDAAAGRPAYNDGADGLIHLDQVLARAARDGIRVLIPLTNNWSDFGGMDQYVRWRGGSHHDDFYTDPVIRGWYADWITHLLNRVNTVTGVAYRDDPTIMAWELGNEPRCVGSGVYPRSPSCTTATLNGWADTMSRHIKSIDGHHLVSVGDEGFLCTDPTSTDWTVNCGEGVDSIALASLPAVDLLSYHLYPDSWKKTADWGTAWITTHVRAAQQIRKPSMLGEFGLLDRSVRNTVYQTWTDTLIQAGGTGFLYWILSGVQDDGTPYPDYDGFTVYCPGPVCTTLSNAGRMIRGALPWFPPVADDDSAVTPFGTAADLPVTGNDISYPAGLINIDSTSVDLDPVTAGRQQSVTVPGGVFVTAADGSVTFTPADGFAGRATASYTVRDTVGRVSNVAALAVTVKPNPAAPLMLYSFETGTEGWAPGNWQTDAGSVAQSMEYATDGTHGLRVDSTGGAWFGVTFAAPVDLSARGSIAYDLRTGATGTSRAVALQTGPGFAWCQSSWGWIDPNTSTTVELGFATDMPSCPATALADVRGMFIWFSTGTFDLDAVRAL